MPDYKDLYKTMPEAEYRSVVLQQLFREYDSGEGTITPETALEVQHLALQGLGVCGDGWEAAQEALKIAAQQKEE